MAALLSSSQKPRETFERLPIQAPAGEIRIPVITRVEQRRCQVGQASQDLRLLVLGHYDSATLSSVWVGEAAETGVADIEIGAGDPIHLVISAHGRTIYRFTGAVDRVRRLTLINHHQAGATGVRADRIEFGRRCFDPESIYRQTASAAESVRNVFGQLPDALGGAYQLWRARIDNDISVLPAPRIERRFDAESDQLYRFHPGGLSWIDPARVSSNVPVGRFRVLPQEAGVRQLVMSGALERATRADAALWEEQARSRGAVNPRGPHSLSYGVYRVTRPIEIPAGLCGAHLIQLYVPSRQHVRGNPCHSTLYFGDGTAVGPFPPHSGR